MKTNSSLFDRLRSETQSEHESVEKHLQIFRIGFSRNDYFLLLSYFREFYRAYEKQLHEIAPTLPEALEIDLRFRMPLLNEDLKNQPKFPLQNTPEIPSMLNISEIIGAIYVMEGSTLGGQVIHRHLQKTLDLEINETNFFRAYNQLTGPMWLKFKVEAEKIIAPENFELVIASAKKTFTCMDNWLELCHR